MEIWEIKSLIHLPPQCLFQLPVNAILKGTFSEVLPKSLPQGLKFLPYLRHSFLLKEYHQEDLVKRQYCLGAVWPQSGSHCRDENAELFGACRGRDLGSLESWEQQRVQSPVLPMAAGSQ